MWLDGSTVLMLLSRYFNRGSHTSLKSLKVRKFEGEKIKAMKAIENWHTYTWVIEKIFIYFAQE